MTASALCVERLLRLKIIIKQALQLRGLGLTAFNRTVFRAWLSHEFTVFRDTPVTDEEFDLLLRVAAGEYIDAITT